MYFALTEWLVPETWSMYGIFDVSESDKVKYIYRINVPRNIVYLLLTTKSVFRTADTM